MVLLSPRMCATGRGGAALGDGSGAVALRSGDRFSNDLVGRHGFSAPLAEQPSRSHPRGARPPARMITDERRPDEEKRRAPRWGRARPPTRRQSTVLAVAAEPVCGGADRTRSDSSIRIEGDKVSRWNRPRPSRSLVRSFIQRACPTGGATRMPSPQAQMAAAPSFGSPSSGGSIGTSCASSRGGKSRSPQLPASAIRPTLSSSSNTTPAGLASSLIREAAESGNAPQRMQSPSRPGTVVQPGEPNDSVSPG